MHIYLLSYYKVLNSTVENFNILDLIVGFISKTKYIQSK